VLSWQGATKKRRLPFEKKIYPVWGGLGKRNENRKGHQELPISSGKWKRNFLCVDCLFEKQGAEDGGKLRGQNRKS